MVNIYVEGGGDRSPLLKTECRKGFTKFLEKAGLKGRMPHIVACGSRQDVKKMFGIEVKKGNHAILLVDSEELVLSEYQLGQPDTWLPWKHLAQREDDKWERPSCAKDVQCHLMVESMENWFLADRDALIKFFGKGFAENKLPSVDKAI